MSNVSFACGPCCVAQSFAWNITEDLKLPAFNTVLSCYWIVGMLFLLVRILHLNASSIRNGYSLVISPVEAIRKSRQTKHEKLFIPSFYFVYVVINSVYMLLEVILTFPNESPFLTWTYQLLCGTREAVDVALVVFLTMPRITKWTRWLPLLIAVFVEILFSLVVFLTPPEPFCPWCTQHLVKSDVSWLFLIEAVGCLLIALLAVFRPFKENNPRPAAFVLCLFWVPIYAVLSVTLPVMKSFSPQSLDGGFCANMAIIAFYYIFYPVVVYIVILKDSRYVFANRLDDSLIFKDELRPSLVNVEETESLMREYPISGMMDLIGDNSLSIISWDELVVGRKLGAGGYGEVYFATWNGTPTAVKSLIRLSEKELKSFVGEMQMLAMLRHPHILMILGVVLETERQCLVTEFCAGGSLHEWIHGHRLSAEQKRRIAIETASAMEYLHGKSIIHRDLKPGNILLTDNLAVRVCDFGLSRNMMPKSVVSTAGYGTVLYSSPEMLQLELNGKFCDVWSFGVVLWELASEKIPYSDQDRGIGAIILGIVQGTLRLDSSKNVFGICIDRCTAFKPEERPTFSEILKLLY